MRNMKLIRMLLAVVLIPLMVLSISMSAMAAPSDFDPVSITEGAPLEIVWDYWTNPNATSPYQGTVTNVDGGTYIPQQFLLWAEKTVQSITASNGATVQYKYDSADGTNSAYLVDISGISTVANPVQILSVTLTSTSSGNDGTYVVYSPNANGSVTSNFPTAINGYLPIGQYSNFPVPNGYWNCLYKNGTNANPTDELKFLNGMEPTGVSLGLGGGYIQFEYATPIYNDPLNPYGLDFIVYGNAFTGNPEPGAVQVSADGINWYELAGSFYYDSSTLWNQAVTYTNNGPGTGTGIVYSFDGGLTQNNLNTASTNRGGWFPQTAIMGNVWGGNGQSTIPQQYPSAVLTSTGVYNVDWPSATVITYGATPTGAGAPTDPNAITGVSVVPDFSTGTHYRFGYTDVHPNGSNYGVATNPYDSSTAVGTSGGDGFDISWAVDKNGDPVFLESVKYIRVFTAVINDTISQGNPFGETSTEVCGVYVATGTGSGDNETDLEVYIDNLNYDEIATSNMATQTVYQSQTSEDYDIYSDEDYVYVNGTSVSCTTSTPYSFNVSLASTGDTAYYQIITQNGSRSPYITLLKIIRT